MLRERVITAVILALLFALLLGFANQDVFILALACIASAAAWEWGRLAGLDEENPQLVYAAVVGLLALLVLYSPLADTGVRWLLLPGTLFWLAVLALLYLQPVAAQKNSSLLQRLMLGGLILCVAVVSIHYLRHVATAASSWLLLYALAVVWVMDIGAYFSGRRFGRQKLAPLISPGKTREGVYGGLLAALLLFVLALLVGNWPAGSFISLLLATLFAALMSVVGDLYESRIKRAAGCKDSSQLLPGHGGVLDRIDGVVASLPVFAFFWAWT